MSDRPPERHPEARPIVPIDDYDGVRLFADFIRQRRDEGRSSTEIHHELVGLDRVLVDRVRA